jgi:hypothetical protein
MHLFSVSGMGLARTRERLRTRLIAEATGEHRVEARIQAVASDDLLDF